MTTEQPGNQFARRLLAHLRQSPLLHFILLGIGIFILAHWHDNSEAAAPRTIIVDSDLTEYLENLYTVQFGLVPDQTTRDTLISNYLREEVLYREALRQGLAEKDEIIRRRLIQKMQFLLEDAQIPAEPEPAVLLAWYQNHESDYVPPARVSFTHVYFSIENSQPEMAGKRAESMLAAAATVEPAPPRGDRFALDSQYQNLTPLAARQLFGQTPFVDALFTLPVGVWSGPLQSGFGLHLIKVDARDTPQSPGFTFLQNRVLADWQTQASADALANTLATLQARYTVVHKP